MSIMNHPKTDELRKRWVEYVEELNKMRWNLLPANPDHARFTKAFTTLMQVAKNLKSTSEIEEGDTVTNGNETFIVAKVENERVYMDDVHFYNVANLRIKRKFE